MKQVKTAKRIVSGLLGTVVLTSFILFALDAYSADQATLHSAVPTNADIADQTKLSKETTLHAKDEKLSIGASERHMLYQPQDTLTSETERTPDTVQAIQPQADTTQDRKAETEFTDAAQTSQSKIEPSDAAQTSQSKTEPSDAAQSKESVKSSDNSKKGTKEKSDSKVDKQSGQQADKHSNTFQTVTEDYFSDAVFIGDSRTVGMMQSHLLSQATYYAKTGIGIGDILSERIVNEGGRMVSVTDALSMHSFGKVYIMIGINDIARGDVDWFTEQYENILSTVRQTQPDAVIYIQGNIPMSYGTQDLSGALNNKNLSLRNEASRALADSENIFYLDIDKIYMDTNGNLKSNYTRDGLHVSSNYYPLWVDYLLQHAIIR